MFTETTTAAKVITLLIVSTPLIVLACILYHYLSIAIASKRVYKIHGHFSYSFLYTRSSASVSPAGYSISNTGTYMNFYKYESSFTPTKRIVMGFIANTPSGEKQCFSLEQRPFTNIEDPYKKYGMFVNGTLYYCKTANGRLYYIGFQPDKSY